MANPNAFTILAAQMQASSRRKVPAVKPDLPTSDHGSEAVKKLFAGGSPIDHEYAILAP